MGPDCDDAGALAILHALSNRNEAEIVGVMHCTSSQWGAGCIDAINAYCGRPDIPVGSLKESGFIETHPNSTYNEYITRHFSNRFATEEAPDALGLYRKLLAAESDNSVVIIAIGPLPNLRDLLESPPDCWSPRNGKELVAEKVKQLVIMGGHFPEGKEWNFEAYPSAAQTVVHHWPTPILFSGFEIGAGIMTGSILFNATPANNPVRKAYELFLMKEGARSSWDLTAVLCGVRGYQEYWSLSANGLVEVDDLGGNHWRPSDKGLHRYLVKKTEEIMIEVELETLLIEASARH